MNDEAQAQNDSCHPRSDNLVKDHVLNGNGAEGRAHSQRHDDIKEYLVRHIEGQEQGAYAAHEIGESEYAHAAIAVREPAEEQCRSRRRAAKDADGDGPGCRIETLAHRERHEMGALKQGYATGKSRSEHQEHRAMAQIGKAASPTHPVTPASQKGIRVGWRSCLPYLRHRSMLLDRKSTRLNSSH